MRFFICFIWVETFTLNTILLAQTQILSPMAALNLFIFQQRSDEFIIDSSVYYVPDPYIQCWPCIAHGNTTRLVIWSDERFDSAYYFNVMGSRIGLDGTNFDPAGIQIYCRRNSDQIACDISFDGSKYLIVWYDYRNTWDHYYGILMDEGGNILDTTEFVICNFNSWKGQIQLARGDTNYLAVWSDWRNSPGVDTNADIYGTYISLQGVVADTIGFPISLNHGKQLNPSVSFKDSIFLIVWQDERNDTADIYGARVTTNGLVLDTNGFPISLAPRYQENPDIVATDSNFFIIWQDWRNHSAGYDIYGARISFEGTLLDTNGIPISTSNNSQIHPAIAFDGINLLAVWEDERDGGIYNPNIYCARISQSGEVLDPNGIPVSIRPMYQTKPKVTFDGVNYCIVWDDLYGSNGHYNHDVFYNRVTPSGIVLDSSGFVISTSGNAQRNPTSVFGDSNFLCLWRDKKDDPDTANIYGTRISPNGTILDSLGLKFNAAPGIQKYPSASFDGTNYLLVWITTLIDTCEVKGARVNQNGILLDSINIHNINSHYFLSKVASAYCNGYYLCAWEDGRIIHATRIRTDGSLVDTLPIEICPYDSDSYNPFITCDNAKYMIVWESYDYLPWSSWNILGARVDTSGMVLDPSGINITRNCPSDEMAPAATYNGNQHYFIVWQDRRNGNWDIYGTRMTTNGNIIDSSGIGICVAPGDQIAPKVVCIGQYYLVVWQDFRNGLDWDIYCAKVDTHGVVLSIYPVTTMPNNQVTPFISKGLSDQCLITWSGWTDSIGHHRVNTMRIWGKFYPFTSIEEVERSKIDKKGIELEVYPIPFKDYLTIKFNIPNSKLDTNHNCITLRIYDATGRLVKNFTELPAKCANARIIWHGDDDFNHNLPSGVYFIKLNTLDFEEIKKTVFLNSK